MNRSGILAAGNFIVDHVKIIDAWPQQDMLATIHRESQSNGGGPYNVLKDLSALGVSYPLSACGLVGDDTNGAWIADDLAHHGIDITQLHRTREAATSYTDAMTVQSNGRRTFFHQRGANALFRPSHCDLQRSSAKHFHLGYLMLLDTMDSFDADTGQTFAAELLANVKAAGMITSVDMVSTPHPQFRAIALSALPHCDHLIINEVEARLMLERELPLVAAAQEILQSGVQRSVTLHTEHEAINVSRDAGITQQPSLNLPHGFSQGATGAGDAFAAGVLHGLHEDWPMQRCLELSVCVAAASLTHPSPSAGVKRLEACLQLAAEHGFRAQ